MRASISPKFELATSSSLVVKIGSSSLVDGSGKIRADWLRSVVDDVKYLMTQGHKVSIVSSGAIALGKSIITDREVLDTTKISQKQARAACGQIILINEYKRLFNEQNINIAQILMVNDDTEDNIKALNIYNTTQYLLNSNIVPIVNENDTVSHEEIQYGDNDKLAAVFASTISANPLIILSDIDGLYNKNPFLYQDARHIPLIANVDQNIIAMAGDPISGLGTGGMKTKIEAAQIATKGNCEMIIAPSNINNPIRAVLSGIARYSRFLKASNK